MYAVIFKVLNIEYYEASYDASKESGLTDQ